MTGPAPSTHPYGPQPRQFGELTRPVGATPARRGVIVLIHGGFWRAAYDLDLARPLAVDLVALGYTVWNLDYRTVGTGGGWPNTFADVAAGLDLLAELDVDTSRVITVGHSAGGHLATWSAGRYLLAAGAPGASPRVSVTGVVAQAGVLALARAARERMGDGAVLEMMGAGPDEAPAAYAAADPIAAVPLRVPVVCVHGRADTAVGFEQSQAYVQAATRAGARARLVETGGDHSSLIDPRSADWAAVVELLPDLP